MSPILSIIIPAYNAAAYLQPCLDSIFSQEYTDFETIVIDDGSTDNTATLLEQYPQVKVIRQENQGMSTARNRGIGTEAARIFTGFGFHVLGLHRIFLRVLAGNEAARRSYEKAGFKTEGIFRDFIKLDNQFTDVVFMARLNGEGDV